MRNCNGRRASGRHQQLAGTCWPTVCDKIVVDHYAGIGFTKMGENKSGKKSPD